MKPYAKVLVVAVAALTLAILLWLAIKANRRSPDATAPWTLPPVIATLPPSRVPVIATLPPSQGTVTMPAATVYPTPPPEIMGYMDPEEDDYGMI